MPQFDFTTYTPQIFWLLICFGVLYYFVSRIIGPRISEVLTLRETRINADENSAADLQKEIDKIQIESNKLKHESSLNYKKAIDDAVKNCASDREKTLNKVKEDIEKISAKSDKKISEFITKSESDCVNVAKKFADSLVKKFFNQKAKFDLDVKVDVNQLKR